MLGDLQNRKLHIWWENWTAEDELRLLQESVWEMIGVNVIPIGVSSFSTYACVFTSWISFGFLHEQPWITGRLVKSIISSLINNNINPVIIMNESEILAPAPHFIHSLFSLDWLKHKNNCNTTLAYLSILHYLYSVNIPFFYPFFLLPVPRPILMYCKCSSFTQIYIVVVPLLLSRSNRF